MSTKVAHTLGPPARELGEAINSLMDNAKHWSPETLQEHAGHIAADYIIMRDAFDALLYACRLAIPHVETAIIVSKGLNYPTNNTQYALDKIRAAIARAEGSKP
jgi:hypothetical protein